MKLKTVRVQNFRSVDDSEEFSVHDLTCLVGKNEAGKTAILQALEAHRPYSKSKAKFDKIRDYPRRFLSEFDSKHPDGNAPVCTTTWEVTEKEKQQIIDEFGPDCLTSKKVTLQSGYEMPLKWDIPLDYKKAVEYLLTASKLDATEKAPLNKAPNSQELINALEAIAERTDKQNALLQKMKDGNIVTRVTKILEATTPRFLYSSHYDRMSGKISIEHLISQKQNNQLNVQDEIFLSFLEFAGTSLEEIRDTKNSEELIAKCEAASNNLTDQIFKYWSQNDALEVKLHIGSGKPEDQPPFQSGTIIEARVNNTIHRASVPFSERSAGFVWFFSFLIKFSEIKNEAGNVIILLDEPGLTLHGKAQADFLRYIEEQLLPHHQVLFTTHSPFLVPANRLNDVRIVEDVLIYPKDRRGRPEVKGTKVFEDTLRTSKDTLFPLQGALGYDICQSLFVGKNTLLVEGPSDILYLQALSSALIKRNREGLKADWTMCPSGGIDKIQPFISLFTGNQLNIAVLTDQGKGDKTKIERLKKSDILRTGSFYSIADFLETEEADIEDVFTPDLFVSILNNAYGLKKDQALDKEKLERADTNTTRMVKKAEAAFNLMPTEIPEFNHFTPSNWLIQNPAILDAKSKDVNETLDRAEKIFKAFNALL